MGIRGIAWQLVRFDRRLGISRFTGFDRNFLCVIGIVLWLCWQFINELRGKLFGRFLRKLGFIVLEQLRFKLADHFGADPIKLLRANQFLLAGQLLDGTKLPNRRLRFRK